MKNHQLRAFRSCVFSDSDLLILELYSEGMPINWISRFVGETERNVVRSLALTVFDEPEIVSDRSKRNFGNGWGPFEVDELRKSVILSTPPEEIARRLDRDLFGVLFKMFELRIAVIPRPIALQLDSSKINQKEIFDRVEQRCSNCLDVIAYCSCWVE